MAVPKDLADEFPLELADTPTEAVAVPRPAFTFMKLGEARRQPAKTFLVEGVIGKGDDVVMAGPPKQGKSLIAVDLAHALIRGDLLFADRFYIEKPAPVAYCVGEGQSGIGNRLVAAGFKWQPTAEEENRFIYCPKVPNLFDPEHPNSVKEFIRLMKDAYGAHCLEDGLCILDTLARAMSGGNENLVADTSVVCDQLARIKDELRCGTYTLAHVGHQGDRLRGSSNLPAAFDSILMIAGAEGIGTFETSQAKDAESSVKAPYRICVHLFPDPDQPERTCTGGYIEWQEGNGQEVAPRKQTKEQQRKARISRFLQEHVTSEAAAQTAKQIAEALDISDEKAVREMLGAMADSEATVFAKAQKPVLEATGKANKMAWHYWAVKP